jgi:Zn-dependent membrane protease YugP
VSNNSLASFTIVSHELGHAMQDKQGKKLKRLHALKNIIRFLGIFMIPSIVAGVLLLFFGQAYFVWSMVSFGFAGSLFLSALIIRLVGISIEKDASKKAVEFLCEVTDEKQVRQCKKFLKDARLTYWAEFLRVILGWTALSKKTKLFN